MPLISKTKPTSQYAQKKKEKPRVSSHLKSSQTQVESFISVSQVSLKSSNLRLKSNSSQVMLLESPTSGCCHAKDHIIMSPIQYSLGKGRETKIKHIAGPPLILMFCLYHDFAPYFNKKLKDISCSITTMPVEKEPPRPSPLMALPASALSPLKMFTHYLCLTLPPPVPLT